MGVMTPREETRRVMRRVADGLGPGLSLHEFYHCRAPHIGRVRWEISRWLRAAGWSYPRIAAIFGQDHTSIMYGVAKSRDWPATWVTEVLNEERASSAVFRFTVERMGTGPVSEACENAVPRAADGVRVDVVGLACAVEHNGASAPNREGGA